MYQNPAMEKLAILQRINQIDEQLLDIQREAENVPDTAWVRHQELAERTEQFWKDKAKLVNKLDSLL